MRKNKTWLVDLFSNDSVMRKQPVTLIENDDFWTSDTEAYLNLAVSTQEFTIDSAKINLYNKNDGSLAQRDVTIENNEAQYELPQDIIAHFGKWNAQVVFVSGTERYTSPMVNFEVKRTLGDITPEKLEIITGWKDLDTELREFIAEVKNFADNELSEFVADVENFTVEEFVELKMGEELANLEVNYATRLTGVETAITDIDSTFIEDVLGFMPISADDVQEGIILGEGPNEKGWLFKPVTIPDERNE